MAAMLMTGWGRGWGRGWGGDWGADWNGNRGPGERGPRGRQRMFGSGELRLALLGLVGEQPRHGYELIKAIEELSGGHYAPSPGVVYPTIQLLADEGLIEEAVGEGARKTYRITEAGRAELDSRTDEFKAIVERLTALAQDRERSSPAPLKRAVGNLFTAVRHSSAAAEFDRERMHQIADILDEAARKIERL